MYNHIFLQDPVGSCPGLTGNITQYQIRFQTESVVDTENVNIAKCIAGRCNHTFEPPSNPPTSYDSVSVAAENVVGVGAARTCTSQTISELPVTCSSRSSPCASVIGSVPFIYYLPYIGKFYCMSFLFTFELLHVV